MPSNELHSLVFPMSIEKAHGDKNQPQNYKIKGLASTASKDGDGETLEQNFILDRFKYINYNHGKNPNEVIGEITKAKVTKRGLEVEGILYADNPLSKEVYDLASNMKSAGNGQSLGLSIEGRTVEEESGKEGKKIKKAELFGMAVCLTPVNPDTFVDIYKSIFGKEQNKNKSRVMDLNQMTALDLSKAYDKATKEMGIKKMQENKEGEEDMEDEEGDGEIEVEIKKSILQYNDGRTHERIAGIVSQVFEKSITVEQVEAVIAEDAQAKPQSEAMDIVKSYMDGRFDKIEKNEQNLAVMVHAMMEEVQKVRDTVDAFGLKSGISKTETFQKGLQVQGSPYDSKGGSGKELFLSNPQHREIVKSMVVEVLGKDADALVCLETANYLKPHDKALLHEAKGVKIV